MARAKMQVMTMTPAAAARIVELTQNSDDPVAGLRVGIKNGGCAGQSYTMELAPAPTPGDELVDRDGAHLIVDAKAVLYLLGAELDFETSKLRSGFVFRNPNETSACGCGESVALTPALSLEAH